MDFNIDSFLQKFRRIASPDDFLKKTLISIIKEETGATIERRHVTVSGNRVHLTAPSAVKNEIFIKKPLILERLNNMLQKRNIIDIQ